VDKIERLALTLAAGAISATWFAAAAQAQGQVEEICGTRDKIVASLTQDYHQTRRGGGASGPWDIYEIWRSDKLGTWTILRTRGRWSCLVATGDDWIEFAEQ